MAFTTNSVRHLYVANNAYGSTNPGSIKSVVKSGDGKDVYFITVNALGEQVKSDIIPIANIRSIKSLAVKPKVLRKDEISFAVPVPGQTYTIRFLLRSWGSGSAEDQYFKYVGSYKAKAGDTAEALVNAMIVNATKNFAREPIPMFKFTKSGTGASAKLVVEEVETPWVLGKQQGRALDYSIQFVKINTTAGEVYDWGTVTSVAKAYPGLGTNKLARDMEYFYMGERGDIYRNTGWPFTIDTQYLCTNTDQYSIIDIAYFSTEPHNGGAVQSEKQITILCNAGAAGKTVTLHNAITGALATATGLTIVDLVNA